MRGKAIYSKKNEGPFERCSMSLGKRIMHGIYNGVDSSSALLVNEFDESVGNADLVTRFSFRDSNGKLVADKFDRSNFRRDAAAAQAAALSAAPHQEPTPAPSVEPNAPSSVAAAETE